MDNNIDKKIDALKFFLEKRGFSRELGYLNKISFLNSIFKNKFEKLDTTAILELKTTIEEPSKDSMLGADRDIGRKEYFKKEDKGPDKIGEIKLKFMSESVSIFDVRNDLEKKNAPLKKEYLYNLLSAFKYTYEQIIKYMALPEVQNVFKKSNKGRSWNIIDSAIGVISKPKYDIHISSGNTSSVSVHSDPISKSLGVSFYEFLNFTINDIKNKSELMATFFHEYLHHFNKRSNYAFGRDFNIRFIMNALGREHHYYDRYLDFAKEFGSDKWSSEKPISPKDSPDSTRNKLGLENSLIFETNKTSDASKENLKKYMLNILGMNKNKAEEILVNKSWDESLAELLKLKHINEEEKSLFSFGNIKHMFSYDHIDLSIRILMIATSSVTPKRTFLKKLKELFSFGKESRKRDLGDAIKKIFLFEADKDVYDTNIVRICLGVDYSKIDQTIKDIMIITEAYADAEIEEEFLEDAEIGSISEDDFV